MNSTMVWLLLRILFFLALAGALAFGAHFLSSSSDGIVFQIGSTEYAIGLVQFIILLAVVMGAIWLGLRLMQVFLIFLGLAFGQKAAYERYFAQSRQRRGLNAMSDAIIALATGNGKLALQKANQAEKLLKRPEMTSILAIQAAEHIGDKTNIEAALKSLLKEKKTRSFALRALLKRKLAEGNIKTALAVARKAATLQPKDTENAEMLLRLQIRTSDWDGAIHTLTTIRKNLRLPRALWRRRYGLLLTAKLYEQRRENRNSGAAYAKDALSAARLVPDFPLAAALGAEAHIAAGRARLARKMLVGAWKAAPHPALIAPAKALSHSNGRGKQADFLQILLDKHTADRLQNSETVCLIRAEYALEKKEYYTALAALKPLCKDKKTPPSSTTLALLSKIEEKKGQSEGAIRELLERALQAPAGEMWVCGLCASQKNLWEPLCIACGAIDSFSWARPDTIAQEPESRLPALAKAPPKAR